MDASVLQRFEELILARSGLSMRPQEAPLLRKTLAARIQALRFTTAEPYLVLLASGTPRAHDEWKRLFVLLTNQESYFFRDQGQLAVIREHILPQLIERHRQTRTLRIWSAGCSTGEEPYSLAMMLEEVLPAREKWQVMILGTDLSEKALETARSGVYGAWSFRTLDKDIQNRFFLQRGNKWEVHPRLRQNVKIAPGNLLDDVFPSPVGELHDMDLIVCRNVFIYFSREAVGRVLKKFSATLRPDGYLVTGHAELHDVALGDFRAQIFPQTVIYQRGRATPPQAEAAKTPLLPSPPPAPNPVIAPTPSKTVLPAPVSRSFAASVSPPIAPTPDVTEEAIKMIRLGRPAAAWECLETLLESEPRNLAALCVAAQVQANAGHLEEAETLCRRAIEVSAFAPLPYRVLAHIAGERGDNEGAKSLLKKVLYLNPSSVWSYLDLAAIYTGEGDTKRAKHVQQTALDVLSDLKDDLVPTDEFSVESPTPVGEIKRQLQSDTS